MIARSKAEAESKARGLVHRWCVGAALGGLIPGVSLALAYADYVMAKNVAKFFGVVDNDIENTLAAIVGSLVGKTAALAVSTWFPGVNSVVAAGTTKALGEAVISHYKSISPLP